MLSKRLEVVLQVTHQQQRIANAVCRQLAGKECGHCLAVPKRPRVPYPVNGLAKST